MLARSKSSGSAVVVPNRFDKSQSKYQRTAFHVAGTDQTPVIFGDLVDQHLFLGSERDVLGPEGFENFVVEALVLVGEHDMNAGGEAVTDGVAADGLLARRGHFMGAGGVSSIGFHLKGGDAMVNLLLPARDGAASGRQYSLSDSIIHGLSRVSGQFWNDAVEKKGSSCKIRELATPEGTGVIASSYYDYGSGIAASA